MPVRQAIVARLVIAVGAGTMFLVHWLKYGNDDFLFGLGAMVVGLGLALLPDWRAKE